MFLMVKYCASPGYIFAKGNDGLWSYLDSKCFRTVEELRKINEHLGDLIEFRKDLIIDDDFTSEEYFNTLKYIDLLEDEKYEELSEFKIQEI